MKIDACASLEAQRKSLAGERATLADMLRRLDVFAQARSKLTLALGARDEAIRCRDALQPQREQLAALRHVASVRQPVAEARQAVTALAEARSALESMTFRAAEALSSLAAATAEEQAKREALDACDAERMRLSPLWSAAAGLDARIAALADEKEAACVKAQEASARASKLSEAYREKECARQDATVALQEASAELARLRPAQPLAERAAEIDEWLEKRSAFAADQSKAGAELAAVSNELSRAEAARKALEEAEHVEDEALGELKAQLDARMQALDALDEDGARREDAALARTQETVAQLARHAQAYDAAKTEVTNAVHERETNFLEAGALRERLATLEALREVRAAADAEAARIGDLANAAAAPQTAHLRAALVEGAACPVCGSHDHPFAGAAHAAQELVDLLRTRREESRHLLQTTDAELVEIRGHAARVQARLEEAQRRLEQAQSVIAAAVEGYEALFGECAAAPREIENASTSLIEMAGAFAASREAFAQKLAAARQLRGDIESLRKEEARKREAHDARRREREQMTARLHEAAEKRASLAVQVEALGDRIASLDRSLAPFLTLAGLSEVDLARDVAGVQKRLEALSHQFLSENAKVARLDEALRALGPEVASLAAQVEGAGAAEIDLVAVLAELSQRLEAARAQRATLLEGEETETHRARFEAAYKAASDALDAARVKLRDAMAAKAAIDATHAHALSARDLAELRAIATQAAYHAALTQAGLSEGEAEPLLATEPADEARLRETVVAADVAVATTEAALAQRQADFNEAQSFAPQDVTREEIVLLDEALAQKLEEAAQQFAALGAEIKQDDRAREAAAALTQDVARTQAARKVWAEISEAIGSADGGKFRRFAQAVTLGELVGLANRRLELFSRRYRLERGEDPSALGLLVIDRDLGDERRSTRSLSGGERFLISLALALALAGLEGRDSFIDTLFIDEGFGALDSATLDVAIDALETLQAQGRRVGVISHVEAMQQRIGTKVCVERRGGGVSVVRLRAPGFETV